MIIGFIASFSLIVSSQENYSNFADYTAMCNETDTLPLSPTKVYLQNDSIIIKEVSANQCCPKWTLNISELIEDTIFIDFADTATKVCDCDCSYEININAGKLPLDSLTIVYNGISYFIGAYDSIMVEGKQWNVLGGGYGVKMKECCYATTFYKIEADSTVNAEDEKQILESTDSMHTWIKIGNIKEKDKKVYFRDLENNNGLIYDFGAAIGDFIEVVNYFTDLAPDTIVARIEDIDTISYSGILRQRFEVFDTLNEMTDYWICGIGSVNGLLNSFIMLSGGIRELLCVYDDENQIYENSERQICYLDTTDLSPLSDFNYYILESYPVQIALVSTALYADSIIWKGVSQRTLSDTLLGSGENITIKNPYKLFFEEDSCSIPPCDGTIYITQEVFNKNGKDSLTKAISIPYYSSSYIEPSNYLQVSCFPNPSTGQISLYCSSPDENLTYFIINMLGQEVTNGALTSTERIINLKSGFYYLRVYKDGKVVYKDKLIVKQ